MCAFAIMHFSHFNLRKFNFTNCLAKTFIKSNYIVMNVIKNLKRFFFYIKHYFIFKTLNLFLLISTNDHHVSIYINKWSPCIYLYQQIISMYLFISTNDPHVSIYINKWFPCIYLYQQMIPMYLHTFILTLKVPERKMWTRWNGNSPNYVGNS